MAKIIQVIDVDSDGHKVRLDDGRIVRMPHGGEHPHVGQEVDEAYCTHQPEHEPSRAEKLALVTATDDLASAREELERRDVEIRKLRDEIVNAGNRATISEAQLAALKAAAELPRDTAQIIGLTEPRVETEPEAID